MFVLLKIVMGKSTNQFWCNIMGHTKQLQTNV